jgi:hypothetical protein
MKGLDPNVIFKTQWGPVQERLCHHEAFGIKKWGPIQERSAAMKAIGIKNGFLISWDRFKESWVP